MPIFGPPNISKLKAKGDVSRLIKIFLEESDLELRKKAAYALGELGDPSAVMPLIGVLKLEYWGGFQMNPSEFLEKANHHNGLRAVVAQVLGNMGDERAVDPLIEVLDFRSANFGELDYLADAVVRALRDIDSTKAKDSLAERGHKT